MNKYRITYPNNKEVQEYKSRTTNHELIHAYDYHFGLNMLYSEARAYSYTARILNEWGYYNKASNVFRNLIYITPYVFDPSCSPLPF